MATYVNIKLPSRCVPYSGVDPSTVCIRPYNGGDEVFLSQINMGNVESKFLLVCEKVLKGIDPKLLTLGDRLYIIMWLCINSYMEEMTITTICPNCFREVDISIDLREIENTPISEEYNPSKPVILSDGTELPVRLFNCEDMCKYEEYIKTHEDGHVFKYARSIQNGQDIIQRMEYFKNLESKDTSKIRAYQEKYAHGPELVSTAVCPLCGKEDFFQVPFRLDFLFPVGSTLTNAFGKGI